MANDHDHSRPGPTSRGYAVYGRILAAAVLVGAICLAVFVFHLQDRLKDLLEWTESHKLAGGFLYAAAYAICTGNDFPAQRYPSLFVSSSLSVSREFEGRTGC